MIRSSLALLPFALAPAVPGLQDDAAAPHGTELDPVVEWVRENAIPLESAEAGHGFEDLEALLPVIGDARIVALGEATHGTREFFQLKHRMLEFLVEKLGFSVFAIEASYPDCVAINDYVEHGVGDAAEALNGQGFWTWDTEEVLALVEWMRSYNADPEHDRKLRFYGIDMQSSAPAVEGALDYVRKHDAELAEALAADLEALTRPTIYRDYAKLEEHERLGIEFGLGGLLEFFDLDREDLVEASSEREWVLARQHAAVATQANDLMAGTKNPPRGSFRDLCMAANVDWVLEQEPAGTRIVLWAHNGHVKKNGPPRGYSMMGNFLEATHGDDHLVIGFGFHHGGFQAIASPREENDPLPVLRPFEVDPPHAGTVGEILGQAGHGIYAIDLHSSPEEGPVAEWLSSTLPMRTIGAVYSLQVAPRWFRPTILADEFDVLLFVQETTPARPNPLTRKQYGIE